MILTALRVTKLLGGFIYPNAGEHSKKYVHDLELYGGKSAVLADDFMRWFAGLCYGMENHSHLR